MSGHRQFCVVDDALPPTDATRLLRRIFAVCEHAEPSTIHREHSDRPLHYRVIDGDRVARDLPEISSLAQRFLGAAQRWYGAPLEPLPNSAVAVNVNVTPAGGTYRWHYDRNAVTVILYLNAVIGGAIEVCPGYRILLPAGWATSRAQRALDRLLETRYLRRLAGHAVTIEPRPGRMVMMRGRRCLHSVQPVVSGSPERVAVVIALDRPGGSAGPGEALDRYLYTAASAAGDPNYRVGSVEIDGRASSGRSGAPAASASVTIDLGDHVAPGGEPLEVRGPASGSNRWKARWAAVERRPTVDP